jgi:hypothetical protein
MMPPDPMPVQEPLLLIRRRPPALALRCAKSNGTLDQVFVRYQQRLRETSE